MKQSILFLSVISMIILLKCTCETPNPIEGVWEVQYMEWSNPDTTMIFEKSNTKGQIKIFTPNYFSWVNQNPENAINNIQTSGVAGSYILKADTLFEKSILSPWKGNKEWEMSSKVTIKGDTLVQVFPYPGYESEVMGGWTGKEIYIKLE